MKRVTFKIAKALKEAGYPQRLASSFGWYDKEGKLLDSPIDVTMYEKDDECVAPYYFEVWNWLWREKKNCIDIFSAHNNNALTHIGGELKGFQDPEEAIIAAIKYLVINNLIK